MHEGFGYQQGSNISIIHPEDFDVADTGLTEIFSAFYQNQAISKSHRPHATKMTYINL